jgi:hydrogenase expression/formation protein HypE
MLAGARPSAASARIGDAVALSGPIGQHGTAILSVREGLGFESDIRTDSQALHRLVEAVVEAATKERTVTPPAAGCLGAQRDRSSPALITRGPAVLAPTTWHHSSARPRPVRASGLHRPLVALSKPAVPAMRARPEGTTAVKIGEVVGDHPGRVHMNTLVGSRRVVDMLVGEQLPRIC